jgi:hypothetical protein
MRYLKGCGHVELIPHSCNSRFCPTCGKHATDVWANQVLNALLDVPYHHLIMAIAWQLRIVTTMNRRAGLNLLVHAATESIQKWARDIKGMRMGILIVVHTFGADMKCPHIHLIVTGGGLSINANRWIATDPKFLMHHGGLKKQWKYKDYANGAKRSYMTLKLYTLVIGTRFNICLKIRQRRYYCRCFITNRIGIMFNPFNPATGGMPMHL